MACLAQAKYSKADVARWFNPDPANDRRPPITLNLYLRMRIQTAWQRRCEARAHRSETPHNPAPHSNSSAITPELEAIRQRVERLLGLADEKALERFEKRLALSEGDLEYKRPVPGK